MPTADIIIENARVTSMDPAHPGAEALAISRDRIAAVGSRTEVSALRAAGTRVIDAGGASVLPGFVESHMHIFPGAAQIDRLSLAGVSGFDAVAAAVRRRNGEQPGDDLMLVEQAHYGTFGDDVAITRHMLDAILPDRPLALYGSDHHTMWANTAALAAAGLLHGKEMPVGSEVVMGGDGLACGELREFDAFMPIILMTPTQGREGNGLFSGRALPQAPTAAQRMSDLATLRRGLAYLASFGITSFHNMDGDPYQLELLGELDRNDALTCRAYMPMRMLPGHEISDLAQGVADRGRYASAHLKTGFVKMFMDGVIESTTAFMLDDYGGHPGVSGRPLFERREFEAICIEADRLGLQIAVHAIGDGAVRWTLDAYEAARSANGPRDSRHRIEHIETVTLADIERFKPLGVVASMQPTHAPGGYYPKEPFASLIGEQRMATAFPWRQLRERGVALCFASDWPVAPIDPLLQIETAMTRRPVFENGPDESQTLHEALAAYTRDGAWVEFAEAEKGRIAPGLLADVVLLDGDIEVAESVAAMKVAMTICGGRVTFER